MDDFDEQELYSKINFAAYPPCIIAWGIMLVDNICSRLLGCPNWRHFLLPEKYTSPGSWFSEEHRMNKLPHEFLLEYMPKLMTYQEYLLLESNTIGNGNGNENGGNNSQLAPYSLESMKQFAFHTSSTSLGTIDTWTSLFAVLVLVIIIRTIKANIIPLFSKFARTVGRKKHGKEWLQQKSNQMRITKFGEYVFRLCFHSIMSGVGIYLFYDKPYWASVSNFISSTLGISGVGDRLSAEENKMRRMGTKSIHINYPFQPIEAGMAWYYLVQAAYNVEAMISLLEMSICVELQPIIVIIVDDDDSKNNNNNNKSNTNQQQQLQQQQWQLPLRFRWSDSCRGDFREMFIHHVFTNLLIFGSSIFRLSYGGSMVFLIHDISDIPVDLSKLANFLKWKTTTTICFLVMCITWVVTRLFLLPCMVWRSMIYEAWLLCADGYIPPINYNMYQPLFVFGLGFLILLHFFWFTMFIRMGYVLIRKGEAHDFSEHKKGENASNQLEHEAGNNNNSNIGTPTVNNNGSTSKMNKKKN